MSGIAPKKSAFDSSVSCPTAGSLIDECFKIIGGLILTADAYIEFNIGFFGKFAQKVEHAEQPFGGMLNDLHKAVDINCTQVIILRRNSADKTREHFRPVNTKIGGVDEADAAVQFVHSVSVLIDENAVFTAFNMVSVRFGNKSARFARALFAVKMCNKSESSRSNILYIHYITNSALSQPRHETRA